MTLEELEVIVTNQQKAIDDLVRWKKETINAVKSENRLKRKQAIAEAKLEETKREQRRINRHIKNIGK